MGACTSQPTVTNPVSQSRSSTRVATPILFQLDNLPESTHFDLTGCRKNSEREDVERAQALALVVAGLSGWSSHALDVARLSGDEPLRAFGMAAFQCSGLVEHFGLDLSKLERFLEKVESGYSREVPYHNRAHAASVLHFMYALLMHGGLAMALG